MRRTTTLTALLLGATLLAPTGGANAVGETCRGEAATIVGAKNQTVTGTDGRDVIVTNAAAKVDAGAGDDLICVTAPSMSEGAYIDAAVDAGPGNDVVDASGAGSTRLKAVLGAGADEFLGGPSYDVVYGGLLAADGYAGGIDIERDVIDTAGDIDAITSGTPAPAGQVTTTPNPDVVVGGEGDDSLGVHGPLTAEGRIDGGGGRDNAGLEVDAATWQVSTATGATRDGVAHSRWTGLESVGIRSVQPGARLTVVGGSGEDAVSIYGAAAATYAVDLAAGDDLLELSVAPSTGSSVALGDGHDRLTTHTERAVVDLSEGVFSLDGSAPSSLTGVEDVFAEGREADLTGDDGDNRLIGGPCSVKLDGRGGNDMLYRFPFEGTPPDCVDEPVRLKGGAGKDFLRASNNDDRLFGGPGRDKLDARGGDDLLRGGPGRDRLDASSGNDRIFGDAGRDIGIGSKGRDLCRTEVRKSCER
ncbi:hemolysin-type calcium-binding region [Nocardioides sp. CF8]|uniref:calcium-binding protein n=1 Tax=Nocardioides sp. CF8 TaxID=110319 RepID=UPI00032F96ED|nr:calcium-binding protein [Nocardioides sp. CF8]EON25543.1 hemolysin-type calcium-binding region [Nocardioides sp. CF8]